MWKILLWIFLIVMHSAFALPPFGVNAKRQTTYGDSTMFYDNNEEEFDYDFGSRNLDIPTVEPANGTTTSTEATRTFLLCTGACVTTNEYNPVCGSDDVSYDNAAKLDCAAHCGKAVTLRRTGRCAPRPGTNLQGK